jgi:hypothetical protein
VLSYPSVLPRRVLPIQRGAAIPQSPRPPLAPTPGSFRQLLVLSRGQRSTYAYLFVHVYNLVTQIGSQPWNSAQRSSCYHPPTHRSIHTRACQLPCRIGFEAVRTSHHVSQPETRDAGFTAHTGHANTRRPTPTTLHDPAEQAPDRVAAPTGIRARPSLPCSPRFRAPPFERNWNFRQLSHHKRCHTADPIPLEHSLSLSLSLSLALSLAV